MKRLTAEQKEEMISLYVSGQIKLPRLLDEKYDVYPGSCYFLLKRRNLIKYSNADQHRLFNENYFENITTEKQAYFLGLIAADGNVSEKRNTISLGLNKEDGLELLEEFKKELSSTGTIGVHEDKRVDYKRKTMVYMQFTSAKTKEDLERIGIGPKKTSNLCYPKINKELDRHFIRGFIDGDGSFYYKRNVLCASIVGTKSILEKIKTILIQEINMSDVKLNKHKTGVFYLNIAHKNTLKLRDWIYMNCQIAMSRKKDMSPVNPNYVKAIRKIQ